MPSESVTANPRIGPEPSQNMMRAAASVVSWLSRIVTNARWKPPSMCSNGGLSGAEFFAYPLVNQHVGVDGHGDRQHEAGNARQRQRRTDGRHQRQDEDPVDHEADDGVHAKRAVGEDRHDGGGGHEPDEAGTSSPPRWSRRREMDRRCVPPRPSAWRARHPSEAEWRGCWRSRLRSCRRFDPCRRGSASRMTGAEMTLSSSRIANGRPTFSCVYLPNLRAPEVLNRNEMIGSVVRWSKPGWASSRSSPGTIAVFLQ